MRVLMVSTEYPPMRGGVGRYTANLVIALRNRGQVQVDVACSKEGSGEFHGISPTNEGNSDVLLKTVQQSRADLVHVQFEPGLYGLVLDSTNPSKSRTFIDSFYPRCPVPIVTTFHSAYTFGEWIGQAAIVKRTGKTGKIGIPARAAVKFWKSFLNYKAFHDINKKKLELSSAGISFSNYMAAKIGGGRVIYHGAEPAKAITPASKAEARMRFSLPQDKMIATAIGFGTTTKGWDILGRMQMPDDWVMVLNSSKGHFNNEKDLDIVSKDARDKVIDLHRGFLSDEELSILLSASDVVLLPYKITSGSGVMFDALAHGLPFVASDLDFFREFAGMGLGMTAKRNPKSFAHAVAELGNNYSAYSGAVSNFRQQLGWDFVANQHIRVYSSVIQRRHDVSIA